MIKRVENFEIAQQIDSRNELHYYSLAEMIEIYNKSNHEMQMEKLKEFLMKAASYDERLRKGEKVTDIYGAEQSFVSMIFKLLDNYSEIFPLAYAYAKKMLEEGKTEIPKSGVLEVDAAILHMKQR